MSESIAEPMSDNEALRRILADLDEVIDILAGVYGNVTPTDAEVDDTEQVIRTAVPEAIKSIVTNLEDTTVFIYEGGCMVAILYLEETWESPLTGSGILTAKCKTVSATSSVAISTYTP